MDARLIRYEQRARPFIFGAAIVPVLLNLAVPDVADGFALTVDLVTWGIFLADLVIHMRYQRRYLRTSWGVFDLAIVVLTFPWYVFPFAAGSQFLVVFRLARLLRILVSGRILRLAERIASRLGGLSIFLAGTALFAGLIVLRVEPPESGFENIGDALWWSFVSFTTVGYGDLYPTTPWGRFAGLLLMMAGLAALGTVSGVLASILTSSDESGEPTDVAAELKALRGEVAELRSLLEERNS